MLFLGREASTPLDLVMGLPLDQRLTCVSYDKFALRQLCPAGRTTRNGGKRSCQETSACKNADRRKIVIRILTTSTFDSNNFKLETGCGITARDVTV